MGENKTFIEKAKKKIEEEKMRFEAHLRRQQREKMQFQRIKHRAFIEERKKVARIEGIRRAKAPGILGQLKQLKQSTAGMKIGKGLSLGEGRGFGEAGPKKKRPSIFD